MAFQPAPNIVGVEVRCTYLGQNVENTLYFQCLATPTATDVQEIAEQVEGWFVTSVLPELSDQLVYRETYARSLETESAPEFTANESLGDTGVDTSAPLPGNVTWTIQFRTGLTGRSYRGRNYIMGLSENQIVGNQLATATAAALVTAYNALLTVASGFDWSWVVLSRQQDGALLPNAIGAAVNNVGYANLDLDSQRRRLAGRGQ